MQTRLICLLLCTLALAACGRTTVSGSARVIDGDSLEIDGTSIRIFGIDAFEGRQHCLRDGIVWECGNAATAMMRNLVAARAITCTQRDIDNYGRTVARCSNGDTDIGAALVLAGLALAYVEYSDDYVNEESRARDAQAGSWAGEFTAPWAWRRNPVNPGATRRPPLSRPADGRTDAGACRIKGNINRRGDHIYHVPGTPSYEQTKIDESLGERWFCSEGEAVSEGWRAPRG